MTKYYVKAASKKFLQELLKEGNDFYGTDYSMFDNQGSKSFRDMEEDDIVAIYSKTSCGNPVSKSWGVKKGDKLV